MKHHLVRLFFTAAILSVCTTLNAAEKPRVIVTTDGEIDDECSLVRFLLQDAALTIPADARPGQTIHVICEVTDNGTPRLTRYQRVVVSVKE